MSSSHAPSGFATRVRRCLKCAHGVSQQRMEKDDCRRGDGPVVEWFAGGGEETDREESCAPCQSGRPVTNELGYKDAAHANQARPDQRHSVNSTSTNVHGPISHLKRREAPAPPANSTPGDDRIGP